MLNKIYDFAKNFYMLKSKSIITKIISQGIILRQSKFKVIKMPERNFLGELKINALLNGVANLIKSNISSFDMVNEKIDTNCLDNFDSLYNMYIQKQRECTRLKNEMLFLKKTILLMQKRKC